MYNRFITSLIVVVAIFLCAKAVSAAPTYIFQRSILPETTNTYYLGSTSPNLQWKGIYTQDLVITGTCTGCGGGDVVGPSSATDNNIARYDGTTGKLIQNSGITIEDDNDILSTGNLFTNQGFNSHQTGSATNIQFGAGQPATGVLSVSTYGWRWTNQIAGATNVFAGTVDTGLNRNAAGILEVNNGTLGQLRDITLRSASTTGQTVLATDSGNVGIGTTSPYAKLSVNGRGVFNQDVRADFYTATGTTASTFAGPIHTTYDGVALAIKNGGDNMFSFDSSFNPAPKACFGLTAGICGIAPGVRNSQVTYVDTDMIFGDPFFLGVDGSIDGSSPKAIIDYAGGALNIGTGGALGPLAIGFSVQNGTVMYFQGKTARIVDSAVLGKDADILSTGYVFNAYATSTASLPVFNILRNSGFVGIGTTTPRAVFQATASSTNATTSIQFGKPNQNKGTCRTEYDTAGSPVYIYIAAGATSYTFQNGGTPPSGCIN